MTLGPKGRNAVLEKSLGAPTVTKEGDRPVPRKYVITTAEIEQAPQTEILLTRWDSSPEIRPKQFEYAPLTCWQSTVQ